MESTDSACHACCLQTALHLLYHMQLTFRTMTRDFDEPNCNGDYLAAKFRNAIMPARGKLHDQRSRLIKINRVSGSRQLHCLHARCSAACV
jgi:hypothetical protein